MAQVHSMWKPSVHNILVKIPCHPLLLTHPQTNSHLFWISRCRHVWTISRSPHKGRVGKKRNTFRNLPFLTLTHSQWSMSYPTSQFLRLLPSHYWLKPSEEEKSLASFRGFLSGRLLAPTGSGRLCPSSLNTLAFSQFFLISSLKGPRRRFSPLILLFCC